VSSLSALSQLQQSYKKIEIFNVFKFCENYDYEDVIRRGKVLNAPLQNDISSYNLNTPLNNEKLQRMEEYIEV